MKFPGGICDFEKIISGSQPPVWEPVRRHLSVYRIVNDIVRRCFSLTIHNWLFTINNFSKRFVTIEDER